MSLAVPRIVGRVSSPADARTALVAALAGAGLSATGYAPDSPTPGAAWPQWTITNWNGHLSDPARYSFDCFVVLNAADPETTVAAGDAAVSEIAPALESVAIVQSAEPVLITFADQTTMPGIRFRVLTRS